MPLLPGTRADTQVVPAAADGEAVAGAALVRILEEACEAFVAPHLESDERTRGVGYALRREGPAVPGEPLACRVELVGREGRRLRFAVEAVQDGRVVMAGHHERELVDEGTETRQSMAMRADAAVPALTYWFDVHSPFCFLAGLRIGDLARRQGAALTWRPISLPRLIQAIRGRQPLNENQAFVDWLYKDIDDWAALAGVALRYHPDFPLRNGRALRVCAYGAAEGKAEAVAMRLLRAYWSESGDITDPAALGAWAADAGLDAEAAAAAATDDHWKAVVEANTRAAIEAGVFGVPTVEAAGKLFFGNDRLDLLERYLSRL